jgi:hypothetical protein
LKITLVIWLLAGAGALAFVLSRGPLSIARANTVEHSTIATVTQRAEVCQADETLPRGVSAIRLRTYAFLGPRVTVTLSSAGRVIASGERASGWTGGVVTVPLSPPSEQRSGVDLCFALFLDGDESVELSGERAGAGLAAQSSSGALPGRVSVEYLRAGRSSWWSLVPQLARRMGIGHAPAGTWSAVLAAALSAAVIVISVGAVVRGLQ